MARKPGDIIHLQVRMPEGLRQELASEAERSGRSLNAEILWRLGQTLNEGWQGVIATEERIEKMQREAQERIHERILNDPKLHQRLAELVDNIPRKPKKERNR
jgi:hypothetical protein